MDAIVLTMVSAVAVIPAAVLTVRAIARLPKIPVVEASIIAILASVAAATISELRGVELVPWVVAVTMVLWIGFLLIFPTGRPTSIPLAIAAAVAALIVIAAELAAPVRPAAPVAFIVAFAAVSAGQVWRYARRSSIAERQTTKWLVLGLLPAIGVFLGWGLISLLPGADPTMLEQPGYLMASTGAMWVVPIAATVGILLQDRGPIDELVRFGIAGTGTILIAAATYIAVTGFAAPVWATAATCAVVLPAAWLSLRVGTRLAYSRGPQRPLASLPARLGSSPDPVRVADAVASTIRDGLGVPAVTVLVGSDVLSHVGDESPTTERVQVDFDHARVAELAIAPRAGEQQLTRRDLRIVDSVVALAAPALRGAFAAIEAAGARAHLVTARADERRRLHADLHDELGPALAGLGFTARAAEHALGDASPDVQRMLTEIESASNALVRRVREISYDLRPEELSGAQLEAILVERLRTADDALEVSFQCEPVPDHLVPDILRIIQEGVANVRRHAAATSCTVTVRIDEDRRVRITVDDDGKGAPPDAAEGIGHPSIHARTRAHDGWADFVSSPNGSRLTAVLSAGGAP